MTTSRGPGLRVLVVLDRVLQDGATTALLALREGLLAAQVEVDVVTLRAEEADRAAVAELGATVVLPPGGRLRDVRPAAAWKLLRRARRAHVVEGHREYGEGLVTAFLLGGVVRRPTVQLLHWDIAVHLAGMSSPERRLTTWIYRRLGGIICVSPLLVRAVLDLGVDPRRVLVARNGVRVKALRDLAAEPSMLVPDVPYVLGLGRLVERKRFDLLLAAHATARSRGSAHLLVIAGGGPEAEALRGTAEELGVSDSVVFSGPVDNPFPLLAGARALCVTSDAEADPMAVLEAAALGVPVIAREAALDWRALAERGISCTRVSDDPAQLATAIVASVRAAPRSAGHRSAAGYDAARMADEHLRALESVGVRSPRSR